MASTPRVAVVGGGIAGTLCSLVLKIRGLNPVLVDRGSHEVGGRLRGAARSHLNVDAGAQFLRASSPQFQSVLEMLEGAGLLRKWQGKFGLLGSVGGGFLSSEIVGTTARGLPGSDQSRNQKDDPLQQSSFSYTDTGDFCGFVTHHRPETYVAIPSNADLCSRICQMADIESIKSTKVLKADMIPEGGWHLQVEPHETAPVTNQDKELSFDALVLATQDPLLAAMTVRTIVEAETDAASKAVEEDPAADILLDRLEKLSQELQTISQVSRQPLFTWSGKVASNTIEELFDGASVPGSHLVQFLAREASKPGRQTEQNNDIWTAVSTSALAQEVLNQHGMTRKASEEACTIMSQEVAKLLKVVDAPREASAVRWASAFASSTLNLKEDCVFLHSWRLAIGGDFVRDANAYPTPLEATAMSGLQAGERIATMFQPSTQQ